MENFEDHNMSWQDIMNWETNQTVDKEVILRRLMIPVMIHMWEAKTLYEEHEKLLLLIIYVFDKKVPFAEQLNSPYKVNLHHPKGSKAFHHTITCLAMYVMQFYNQTASSCCWSEESDLEKREKYLMQLQIKKENFPKPKIDKDEFDQYCQEVKENFAKGNSLLGVVDFDGKFLIEFANTQKNQKKRQDY